MQFHQITQKLELYSCWPFVFSLFFPLSLLLFSSYFILHPLRPPFLFSSTIRTLAVYFFLVCSLCPLLLTSPLPRIDLFFLRHSFILFALPHSFHSFTNLDIAYTPAYTTLPHIHTNTTSHVFVLFSTYVFHYFSRNDRGSYHCLCVALVPEPGLD